MRRGGATLLMLGVLLGSFALGLQMAEGRPSRPKPIIAELFATPTAFAGRLVEVYGLVIESSSDGAEFVLQDVSFRPLKIVGNKKLKAAVGDQVTVIGIFHGHARPLYIAAKRVISTRVTAGGGCC